MELLISLLGLGPSAKTSTPEIIKESAEIGKKVFLDLTEAYLT